MGYRVVGGDLERDRERLLVYWNSHHEKTLDRKVRWLYENNVDGAASFWILEHEESGEVVGVSALFPREFIVQGEVMRGGVAGDLFVSPNHRTLGPALMLQRAVLKGAKEAGLDFVLAFSNKYAELIDKRIGYEKVGHLVRIVGVVRSVRALQKIGLPAWLARLFSPFVDALLVGRVALGARGGLTFTESSSVGESYDQLWRKCSHKFSFVGQKSGRYMNWKYGMDPDDENRFIIGESEKGEVGACLVYRQDGDVYEIRDILPDPASKSGRSLTNRLLLKARADGMFGVVVNAMEGSELARAFAKAGFFQAHRSRAVMIHADKSIADRLLPILRQGEGVCLLKSDEDS